MFSKLKKVLGIITDLLIMGRANKWWRKKPSPSDVFREELKKEK
mgnify:CR=1 FL=1